LAEQFGNVAMPPDVRRRSALPFWPSSLQRAAP